MICSYYSPKGIDYEELFEKLDNKSNNLLIMGDFNAKNINPIQDGGEGAKSPPPGTSSFSSVTSANIRISP